MELALSKAMHLNKKNMSRLFKAYRTGSNAEGQNFMSVQDLCRLLRDCRIFDADITKEAALQILLCTNSLPLQLWITGADSSPDPGIAVQNATTFGVFFKILRCLAFHKAKCRKRSLHLPHYLQEIYTNLVTRLPSNTIKFELILPDGFD